MSPTDSQLSLYLIPALPLAGFLINFVLLGRLPKNVVAAVACGSVLASFVLSVRAFLHLQVLPESARVVEEVCCNWLHAGSFSADIAFLLDPLSAVMILIVTGVGFLIHVYSIGYMAHDSGFARFFSYLNLFMFSMLTLVLANNFLLMFVGWEGVGLCSYLLIGFWFEKQSASDAGKKAFIVNRIGDFGFILGMFIIFWGVGTLNFREVMSAAPHTFVIGGALITAATLLLFVGATGKSAQIPLYVWLPDAMEGPTPVSALIHAATMVTAGVYMVARSATLFMMSPTTMAVVAVIGCATAVLAATIALTQNDIKRVLAYSTVSQLGYMFMACGVAAFSAGVFHLMTHAFFKALLFLGAGSVIHAMSNEQDMRKMGGLRKHLPITFITMLIATLAIAGIPGLSGFFSKDEILWQAFSSPYGSPLLWAVGVGTAALTAFYMLRLIFLTFYGAERMDSHTKEHLHESPAVMTLPLIILAVLSLVGGLIGIPHIFGVTNYFEHWLGPVFEPAMRVATRASAEHAAAQEWALMGASVVLVISAIILARHYYLKNLAAAGRVRAALSGVHRILDGKYFVDEMYNAIIIQPLYYGSVFLWKIVDVLLIDGLINGGAYVVGAISNGVRRAQTGRLTAYATVFAVAVFALVGAGLLYFIKGAVR